MLEYVDSGEHGFVFSFYVADGIISKYLCSSALLVMINALQDFHKTTISCGVISRK